MIMNRIALKQTINTRIGYETPKGDNAFVYCELRLKPKGASFSPRVR